MKKLGVVITDGVGFRNFILSDFLLEAEKIFDEVVLLSCLPADAYNNLGQKSKVIELEVFEEKFKTWFFRKAKEVAHLQLHKKNNFGIQDNYKTNMSTAKNPRGYATRFIFLFTTFFHSEKWIKCYNFFQQLTFANHKVTDSYKEILLQEKFDLIFFTHQRPPFIAPMAYACEKVGIKNCSFIFSWDNLASKGRMAANFDYFLVWSELMKRDLLEFYPEVKNDTIEIVGTPQFEPYILDRYKSSKEEFYSKFKLDTSLKTICFSCGDISTSRNDELYIECIANLILNKMIQPVNLIVRTSPAEDPVRFSKIVEKFPFVKWNYPKWNLTRIGHQEAWSQRIPNKEDIIDLRSLLEYCDININMLSTMTLDFVQFNKPVINPVFGNDLNGLYDDQRFLKYEHIKNLIDSEATKIVKNPEELLTAINSYLENSDLEKENRDQLLQLQVGRPLAGTSKRIAETLLNWA